MTIEQIELRKILTQMLADNGINRSTIKDFVKEVISEKIDNSFKEVDGKTVSDMVYARYCKFIDEELAKVIKQEVRHILQDRFYNFRITVDLPNGTGIDKK